MVVLAMAAAAALVPSRATAALVCGPGACMYGACDYATAEADCQAEGIHCHTYYPYCDLSTDCDTTALCSISF